MWLSYCLSTPEPQYIYNPVTALYQKDLKSLSNILSSTTWHM